MLKRLYIDNYKCFVNFECYFSEINLLMGRNGTGKSSVFEVLSLLRAFAAERGHVGQMVNAKSLTRWDSRMAQTFEMDVEGNGGLYRYVLVVEHMPDGQKQRGARDEVTYEGHLLYAAELDRARLFKDNYTEGPELLKDWYYSGLPSLPERPDNSKIRWFRQWLFDLTHVKVCPQTIVALSEEEESSLKGDASNFASWYRHLSQERPDMLHELFHSLQDVIDGFVRMRLTSQAREMDNLRRLLVDIRSETSEAVKGSPISFDITELSDGQRMLVILYTLLHSLATRRVTLCIDEPDNFIALSEVQPWLMAIRDTVEEDGSQCLLISHHPELIDYMAREKGIVFTRTAAGPVRVGAFPADEEPSLSASEMVARGWSDE
jgi:ABC-type branched-subunit amino acid transport system ATPase component